MIHKAVTLAKPGDVLVVNAGGYKDYAVFGDLLGLSSKVHGIAGIVIDGATRDAEGLQAIGFPVFARAVLPAGPFKDSPGAVNVPVSCGGVPVRPGDSSSATGTVVVIPGAGGGRPGEEHASRGEGEQLAQSRSASEGSATSSTC
jgi:regulator of RNase E activity RraA